MRTSDDDAAPAAADATAATRAATPAARRTPRALPAQGPAALWGEPGDPVAALHREEAERMRVFATVVLALSGVAALMMPFQATPAWLTALVLGSVVTLFVVALWVRRRIGAGRYDQRVFRVFAGSAALLSGVLCYYGGVFSSAPAVVTLGIAVFGTADDERFAAGISIGAAVAFTALALLVVGDVIHEHGLFSVPEATVASQVFAIAMTVAVLMTTLVFARAARRATREAVRRLADAQRLVQQREALLGEVRRDLDVALRIDVGKRGPYTGATAGAWTVGELIGRGAMGDVYAARRGGEDGERAALKVLAEAARSSPGFAVRFAREARLTQRLDDEHVARVFDVGLLEDETPWFAMELLEGNDLAWILRQRPALPLADVVALAAQVAAGLDAAHRAGVIHRDVKPQNLFLAAGPAGKRWKVIDFGVARDLATSGTITQGAIVGSPGYMSPEQAQGKPAGVASDVFSLGAVLYRALTGRPPFSGPDTPAILYEIVYRQPARPLELAPGLAGAIEAVLAVALAKAPGERFASAGELAQAFAAAAEGRLAPELAERAARLLAAHPWGGYAQKTE